ncbi:sterol O-acyltransferase 1-like isoform X1 [Mytilus trossulus]|uniref:sterol O-acyltransferase 1-like isoform X1 n=1 Tax=Mytilus trossulus TaxID=6551 RepID=UPI003004043E
MSSEEDSVENLSFSAKCNGNNGNNEQFRKQVEIQRLRNQAQALQKDIKEKLTDELDTLFEQFINDVEQYERLEEQNQNYVFKRSISTRCQTNLKDKYRKKNGELPDKVFLPRRSVLTELFEISHIKTIYHMFVAILIVFCLNTFVYDIVHEGRINLNFEMMQWALGKKSKVMELWVMMQLSTLVIVYPMFYYWANNRPVGPAKWIDYVVLSFYMAFMLAFLVLPVNYIMENALPPASTVIIACEQLRLIMKMHSFVRENIPRVLNFNNKKDDDSPSEEVMCPDFSKYLYFLFVPTLIYRDDYPRTKTIRWNYVVTNFGQVIGCLFFIYYIFMRFCVPYFHNFNQEHVTPELLVMTVFGCMLPGTLVLFIGFFAILHSWFNAFAEMLRFADRMFYKDWWNSTSFSNYYRTWNVVVHDWLYTYVYKDVCKVIGRGNKPAAMACVFIFSAIFHEYVLVLCFNFFYPVLLFMFGGAGFGFMFLTDKGVSRSWNVFLWVALFTGTGLLMCLYSMEWYARINCPVNTDNIFDKLIPRSWTCNFEAMENNLKSP